MNHHIFFATVLAFVAAQCATLAVAPGVKVVKRERGQHGIAFTGVLLGAEFPAGPWTAITNAISPYVPGTNATYRFYRAVVDSAQPLFASSAIFPMRITGPLQAHFELAHAGIPDGIIPPIREKPYFAAVMGTPGFTLPMSLRVRGNSSLQECPFPKLKFKVSRDNRAGTPFADAREVKIGTHCAEGGRGTIGRLRDETATFREALVYEVLATVRLAAPKVRRASIEYQDTTPATNVESVVGWTITREALLIEDVEVVAERLGAARALEDNELAEVETASLDKQTVTDLQMFQALIGNWDYSLGWNAKGVWNTDVIEFADLRLMPVAGDFDLASWVTEEVVGSAPHWYHPELPELEREIMFQVERIRDQAPEGTFAISKQRYLEKQTAMEFLVASAQLDERGRQNAARHLAGFFAALQAMR